MSACSVGGCQFCEELAAGASSYLGSRLRRFIFEDDEFAVFAAIGSFVAGYLIMVPRIHVQSFAELGPGSLARASDLVTEMRGRLADHFGPSVLFEHGSHGAAPGGACIDHAHWHIVPARHQVDLLAGSSGVADLHQFHDLAAYSQVPYLMAQQEGMATRVLPNPSVPSQFMRRRLAAHLGVPDHWDWAAYIGRTELHETLDRMGVAPEVRVSRTEAAE